MPPLKATSSPNRTGAPLRPRRLYRWSVALVLASASGCAMLLDANTTVTDHCWFQGEDTTCGRCLIQHCQPALDGCCGDATCAPALTFVDRCAGSADLFACQALRGGALAVPTDLAVCATSACNDACGGGGAGGGVASSSRSVSTGGGGASSASSSRTFSTGSGGAGGSTFSPSVTSSGTGGAGTTSSVLWLNLNGARADASASPNSTLNVDGTFYATGDTCSSLTWDPATRCATGTLCDPGAGVANWGVAIEFYFRDPGPAGSPAATKSTWNAIAAGAKGVAWSVTGTAPGLQVWLTQMDPTYGGTCSGDTCAIQGPPYGASAPGLQQSMLFADVVHDNWGGTGTQYTFDPHQILAVQFKLSTLVASGPFAYCVKELGVIR